MKLLNSLFKRLKINLKSPKMTILPRYKTEIGPILIHNQFFWFCLIRYIFPIVLVYFTYDIQIQEFYLNLNVALLLMIINFLIY